MSRCDEGGLPDPSRSPRVVTLVVNGQPSELQVEPRTTLLDALRTELGLTGAHAGCEYGVCGACTVLVDGDSARSCLLLAVQCAGRAVITIEGLGSPEEMHPMMEAFRRNHGLQCGFCTPAMVLSAVELLDQNPDPTEAEVREALSGNLCRCTGYAGIVAAVLDAAGGNEPNHS
ncbi:MAG: (2Fe-2S)-binding protein [Pseudonocardiales bacterium]|nr:(2Fe-2S)-binding protein [Pseudonocardiales bacterium]